MSSSVFSLEPPGDTPTRRGFFDAILNGAIPVVFRKSSYDNLFPSSPEMDPRLYTVFIDENELLEGAGENFIGRLGKISEVEIREKQLRIREIMRKLQYEYPMRDVRLPLERVGDSEVAPFGEDAFTLLLVELDRIRRGTRRGRDHVQG